LFARADANGGEGWYWTDHLGSVRLITNAADAVLDRLDYDSFGSVRFEVNPAYGDRFKFTSREWDAETGQYYYRARFYDPATGRFSGEDQARATPGNLYPYVGNSPTMATDPSGLEEQDLRNDRRYFGLYPGAPTPEEMFQAFRSAWNWVVEKALPGSPRVTASGVYIPSPAASDPPPSPYEYRYENGRTKVYKDGVLVQEIPEAPVQSPPWDEDPIVWIASLGAGWVFGPKSSGGSWWRSKPRSSEHGAVPPKLPEAPAAKGKAIVIEGSRDLPRTMPHQVSQETIAEMFRESGTYDRVAMGRPLSEFSGQAHVPDIQPDVMGLRPDGRIDMAEVVSPSQTRRQLEAKLRKAMNQLPQEKRGRIFIHDPAEE
jgi:RHS repeat-associated protein